MDKIADFIAVAQGKQAADLVIRGAKIFNSFTFEWQEQDLAIYGDRIVGVGKYEGKKVIEATGKYVVPGFIDGHVHIESSNLTPSSLAYELLPNGVTSIVADPHEIVNVKGLEGLDYMLKDSEGLPVDMYFVLPSCVPCTPFEHSGATVLAQDLAPYYGQERIVGLAEMMDYVGLLQGREEVVAKVSGARRAGKVCDGHAPGMRGMAVNAYAGSGVSSDHECYLEQEAYEKLSAGMYIMIREGSATHNLADLLPLVNPITVRRLLLCTDDCHAADLAKGESINGILRKAVRLNCPVDYLLVMASLNAAERFKIPEVGALAPGYKADVVILPDLTEFRPEIVLKSGKVAYERGNIYWPRPAAVPSLSNSMQIKEISLAKLKVPATSRKTGVIGVIPGQLLTEKLSLTLPVKDGCFECDLTRDIIKISVWERHHNLGTVGVAFLKGFGLREGAMASTVAHDSHNVVAVGTNDEDIVAAVQALSDAGGGLVYVVGGEIKELLPLPCGGLMSAAEPKEIIAKQERLEELVHQAGVKEGFGAYTLLSFLALPVIPQLKITDMGLVSL